MKTKTIPEEWVLEKRKYLQNKLPSRSSRFFYPDQEFYSEYTKNIETGLDDMVNKLFAYLEIPREGCIVSFCPKKVLMQISPDTAGFYTKQLSDENKEVEMIMVSIEHAEKPLHVAAILAHEMMHLYLFRLGIEIEDTAENELLTDLATIETGLGILTLNGMARHNHIALSIVLAVFGFIYWSSGDKGYGYFVPKQYVKHLQEYLKNNNVQISDIAGLINPSSRPLVTLSPYARYKNTTQYISQLEKEYIKTVVARGILVAIVLGIVLYSAIFAKPAPSMSPEYIACVQSLGTQDLEIINKRKQISDMELEVNKKQIFSNSEGYDDLVTKHDLLIDEITADVDIYNQKVSECNALLTGVVQ